MNPLLRRLAHLVIVLGVVTFVVSTLLALLPGDPAHVIAGENATPEQISAVRVELHLDDSPLSRYGAWLGDVVRGDLGTSYRTGQDVLDAILQRMPVSLQLMLMAQLLALLVAVPLAVWTAYRPRTLLGRGSQPISVLAISIPEFVLGLILIYVCAMKLGWFPATGFVPLSDGLGANLQTMILPALVIAAEPSATYFRLLRLDMTRTLGEDFVLAANAKGMSTANVLFRHALRPSSLSVATLAGLNTARLLGTVVVVESLFGLPGMGRLLVESINASDLIMVQGAVCVIALVYVLVNALTDVLYPVLDPRVRHGAR